MVLISTPRERLVEVYFLHMIYAVDLSSLIILIPNHSPKERLGVFANLS